MLEWHFLLNKLQYFAQQLNNNSRHNQIVSGNLVVSIQNKVVRSAQNQSFQHRLLNSRSTHMSTLYRNVYHFEVSGMSCLDKITQWINLIGHESGHLYFFLFFFVFALCSYIHRLRTLFWTKMKGRYKQNEKEILFNTAAVSLHNKKRRVLQRRTPVNIEF